MYCLHCDHFVETKLVRPGSSGVTLVLIGLTALCAVPAFLGESVGGFTLLSVLFGTASALYVTWRRPRRYLVCATCGSPYLVKDVMPSFRRAA